MEYEINSETLAVIPLNNKTCKVIEAFNEYQFKGNPLSVIEHSCEYFGSTYNGRYKGTKCITGITHKSPIIIEEINKLIFFPTTSPINEDCIWISLNNILKFEKVDPENKSKVIFKNGSCLIIDISYNSLRNQIFRASRLQVLLDERTKTNLKF